MSESQMIDGQEFLIKVTPVRTEVTEHECVCLLIKGPELDKETYEAMCKAAEAAGIPEDILQNMVGNQDKCHHMVDNPDQAFCDGCENEEHHLLPNQMGDARNIHREGKNP